MGDELEDRTPPPPVEDGRADGAIAGFGDGEDDKKAKGDKKPEAKSDAEKTAKEREDDKKKKERDDAKKESKYKASKYSAAQANVMLAQGRSALMALPFIIVGLVALIVVLKNGGRWVQGATKFLMDSIVGKR
ncbi:MAG: hypothetical protein LBU15_04445 [Rickettsiales bacterium]|jgi:hypothetical protein|nr:hypothetical protein [Rickettsiales bacterium]